MIAIALLSSIQTLLYKNVDIALTNPPIIVLIDWFVSSNISVEMNIKSLARIPAK